MAELGPDRGHGGLRVDMDALPVEERTGLPYASTRQGLMHACGHEKHTCWAWGWRGCWPRSRLCRRVRLLFQPAGVGSGAVWMRDAGAVEGLDALYGCMWCRICRWARWESGGVSHHGGRRAGGLVRGGGHGAATSSADAVWLAARVITELQQTISRRLDALQPVVISFGKVDGRAFSVVGDQVRLLGTVRCLDLQQHAMPAWIEETVQGICVNERHGGGELPLHCAAGAGDPSCNLAGTLCGGVSGPRQGAAGGATFLGGEDFAGCFGMCRE